MLCFRDHSGWLKHRVNKIIRDKHTTLIDSPREIIRDWCNFNFFDRKRWWVIALFVGLILFGSLFFHFFEYINIDLASSKTIIDQRITNLAAIIAMSIAVVGFLISNLAVKEAFAYEMLFTKSKLYPIIYFTLSLIGYLIIISTLRDYITSEFIYSRLVVTGTYLALAVLFLIGYLFRIIIRYTNSRKIHELLEKQLLHEGRGYLKQELIKHYSQVEYNRFIRLIKVSLFDVSMHINLDELVITDKVGKPSEDIKITQNKIIDDIDLYGLAVFVNFKKQTSNEIISRRIKLDDEYVDNDFIWSKGIINSSTEQKILGNLVRLKRKKDNLQIDTQVRKYFADKLEEFSNKSEYKNLDSILQSYIKLYEFQMQSINK